jgi:hypothetical protein
LAQLLVHDFEYHGQVFARGRPAEHRWSPATPAGPGGFVALPDDFFGLLDRDALLGDVLNVSLRILCQVSDALDVRHRAILRLSCVILQEESKDKTRLSGWPTSPASRPPASCGFPECALNGGLPGIAGVVRL